MLASEEARKLPKIRRTKLRELTKRNQLPARRLGASGSASLRCKRSGLLPWPEGNRIQPHSVSSAMSRLGRG